MRYILAPDTYPHQNPSPNQPLRCSSYRSYQVGDGWLLVSPDTKGWCVLNDQEYAVYKQLAMQSSFIVTNEPGTSEKNEFIAELIKCGVVRPVSDGTSDSRDVHDDSRPFFLTLILSAHCNLACRYCYLGMGTSVPRGHLDVVVACEAIRSVFDMPHKHITIDFGEIALSFSLFKKLVAFTESMQRKRADKVVTLAIQTNGTGLTPSILDYIERHRVFVGISIDGPRQFHDRFRVSPAGLGSHLRAESGLRELVRRKVPHIVLCTVSSGNVKHPEKLVDYFLELGVSHFAFKPVIMRGSASKGWHHVGISVSEYKEFLSGIINYSIKQRTWKALDVYLTQSLFKLMRDPRGWAQRCPSIQCGAARDMLVLNPYGDFYPCPRLSSLERNSFYLGNTFADAIRAGKRLPFGSPLKQCAECIWSPYCEGPCRLSTQSHQSTAAADDFTCGVQQHVYRLLVEKLIPATDAINAGGGPGPGQFKLIQRNFFNSSSARRDE